MPPLADPDAGELFVERARAVVPSFQGDDAVGDICARLDNLPLALELAAARVKLLSPERLAARLERQLELLTGGPRDSPSRQQTLRAAIAWSYDLLAEPERRLQYSHFSPLTGEPDKPENYHIVSFDLRPTNGGTEVVLTQVNKNDKEALTSENRQEYAKNWTMVLDGLKKTVEGTGRTEKTGIGAEARS